MSENRYVERDGDGLIVGDYANPQPGYAEEEMPVDAAEFLAWRERQEQTIRAAADSAARKLDAVVSYIASKPDAPQELRDVLAEAEPAGQVKGP